MINRLSILFVLLTSLLALSACGGEIEYLMTKQTVYDVDGSVRYYILYEYDKKNNLVKESDCDKDGNIRHHISYQYDKDNKLVISEKHIGNSLESRAVYKYDDKGREIEKKLYNKSGVAYSTKVNTYEESGHTEVTYDEDSNIKFTRKVILNDKGDTLKIENVTSLNSKIIEEYEYDESGYLIKCHVKNDDAYGVYTIYINDSKGRVLERQDYQNGELARYLKHTYDKNGNLVAIEVFSPYDIQIGITRYEYKKAN